MRPHLAAVAVVLALAGCSQSTLPADDQQFCADQADKLADLRDELGQLIDGDRHWSSDGEAFATREVYVDPGASFLTAFHPQDPDLKERVDAAASSLFYVQSGLIGGGGKVFDDDAKLLRDARRDLAGLDEFCDENG